MGERLYGLRLRSGRHLALMLWILAMRGMGKILLLIGVQIMVYAPRDEDEVEFIKHIVHTAVCCTVGMKV